MSETELKNEIVGVLLDVHDIDFLEEIKRLLNEKTTLEAAEKIPDFVLKEIEEGEAEIERGEFYTEEEANKDTDEWLKKL